MTIKPSTVTLDMEVIEQWSDWLDLGDEDLLRRDFKEVLTHPERCQPSGRHIDSEKGTD